MPVFEIAEIERQVEQCRAESKLAVERAEAATSQEVRAEYLRVADEWLMLAGEVAKLRSDCQSIARIDRGRSRNGVAAMADWYPALQR
jgi:hypothetical protein